MSDLQQDKIAFEVETARILEILSKEIYDSPLALLRENIQNAYDATLMRCTLEGIDVHEFTIEVNLEPFKLTITDHGIGMSEDVLRNNFWKAGSSGKKSELARKSGVIGTFGIGAMANFGVCTTLRVETRPLGSDLTLVSTAKRESLSISKECIDLARLRDDRLIGTTLVAELDPRYPLTETAAKTYLLPYVAYLPVKVLLNGQLISQKSYSDILEKQGLKHQADKRFSREAYEANVQVYLDSNAQVVGRLNQIKVHGENVVGDLMLMQNGGQLMGLRNYFGLAPIPIGGYYQLGGFANLSILQPTAGREALSRESIDHLNHLITLAEDVFSLVLPPTDAADRNLAFQNYLVSYGKTELAYKVTVEALPEGKPVPLGEVNEYSKGKKAYYYTGRESSIIQTFANEGSVLLHVSQSNPRKQLQLRYITEILQIEEVPDKATILRVYRPAELQIQEAALLVRIAATLSEDYLLPDVEAIFADISHEVTVHHEYKDSIVHIYLSRNSSVVRAVLETYRTAYEVFPGFVKDFVRNHLYQRLSQYIPSSTREGVDALARVLQRNRELYRYEENELGNLEPLLGDYLAGGKSFAEVLISARNAARPSTQTVSRDQVGSLEQAIPDVTQSPAMPEENTVNREHQPVPAIMREDVQCDLKILFTNSHHPQLNNFELFLGLSDRLVKRERHFFHTPHTTKIIWAGHRVIYIFTEASGRISLYYDIELREPLDQEKASGGMFPTTTLITKNRIYVPVPTPLEQAFRVVEGYKEFYVRFDTIMSEVSI